MQRKLALLQQSDLHSKQFEQALLDVDMSNSLSLKEFVHGLKASTDCLDALGRAQREALTVLAAVSKQVRRACCCGCGCALVRAV